MSTAPAKSAPRVARVLLRLPAEVHAAVVKSAAEAGLSVNEFCVRRLRAPVDQQALADGRTEVVARARALFGDQLAGVVVLGSWARREAAASSDVDVLIVLDPARVLSRDLYRVWDAEPQTVDGRVVDAHFTHLPPPATPPTAVWCEAAVDGIVWDDRDGAIEARLGDARRAIADGRVVRAFAHGQPYWKGAA